MVRSDLKWNKLLLLVILPVYFGYFFLTTSVVFANDENRLNTSINDTWLSCDSFIKILENLKVETYLSGDVSYAEYVTGFQDNEEGYSEAVYNLAFQYSTTFNRWFNTYSYDNNLSIENLLFNWSIYTNNSSSFTAYKKLTIIINSSNNFWTDGFTPYFTLYSYEYNSVMNFSRFAYWNYDSNNNITGATSQNPSNNLFLIDNSTVVAGTSNNVTQWSRYFNKDYYLINGTDVSSSVLKNLSFSNNYNLNHNIAVRHYFKQGNSTLIEYLNCYITSVINLNSGDVVTPTPTPTGIPSGGGSTDLTETNNLIGGITDFLSESGDSDSWGIPSSGEIVGILFPSGDSNPFDNYFTVLFNNLTTVLTSTSGYNFIDVDFLGTNYRIWASDFYFDYPLLLAQLIPGVFTLGVVFAMLKFLHHIYFLIQTLKISGFSSIAEDDMSHLM